MQPLHQPPRIFKSVAPILTPLPLLHQKLVAEFFHYGINSILYQRGIYPPAEFDRESKYGLAMMVAIDEKLRAYLTRVLQHLEAWLLNGEVQRVALVIKGVETGEVFERWVFEVEATKDKENNGLAQSQNTKTKKEISSEISALLRQITATVTFLPMLPEDEPASFDILMYTDHDIPVPVEWADSDAQVVKNPEIVKLRHFSTNLHRVDSSVAYRGTDDGDI